MTVLANDGISNEGKSLLEAKGFQVLETKVAKEQLVNYINKTETTVLLVRSATNVDRKIIDDCPTLQIIGRGGVGLDNIAVDHARSKGIKVIHTPAASANAVAELVIAHLLNGVRFLADANRNMPLEGDHNFKGLKKAYQMGRELSGKTLGIIGMGNAGQMVAKKAIALGMQVCFHDLKVEEQAINLGFYDGQSVTIALKGSPLKTVLTEADFITLHVPAGSQHLIGKAEIELLKSGAGIVNIARGGLLDEVALVDALDKGKVSFAGLDVFEAEPNPEIRILMHPKISLSPHIGGSTLEAQDRISIELATQIIKLLA
ncbi:MAG: D-2-hydroxyacid dehydrogenase [Bacteroidota bacterium]